MVGNVLLLGVVLFLKYLYIPLNRRKSRYYFETRYDKYVPLVPWFVIPYIAYFPFIALALLGVWGTPHITTMLVSFIIAYSLAILVWYFIPNGVARPMVEGSSVWHRMLRYVYRYDNDTNGFPSGHVFVSLLCGYYLALAFPQYTWAAWTTAILISASTLLTKQHYVLDVPGGVLVSVLAISAGVALV